RDGAPWFAGGAAAGYCCHSPRSTQDRPTQDRPTQDRPRYGEVAIMIRFGRLSCIAVAAAATLLGEPAARAAEPITIGFSMELTGPFAVVGKTGLLAFKIWEEAVNAKGGLLGRPVKLVYYDDQSNPALVPGIYTKLIDV